MSDTDRLVGKTIARFAECDDHLLIFFTDGEYAAFRSTNYGGERGTPVISYLDSPTWSGAVEQQVETGVMTAAEGTKLIAELEERDRQNQFASDKAAYERLRKKFESTG